MYAYCKYIVLVNLKHIFYGTKEETKKYTSFDEANQYNFQYSPGSANPAAHLWMIPHFGIVNSV